MTFIIFHLSEIVRLEHSCPKPMKATRVKSTNNLVVVTIDKN